MFGMTRPQDLELTDHDDWNQLITKNGIIFEIKQKSLPSTMDGQTESG